MKAMQICAVLCLIVGFNQASVRIRREYGVYNYDLGNVDLDGKQRRKNEMENGNIGGNSDKNNEMQGVRNISNAGINLGTILVTGKSEHNSRREFGVSESNSFGLNFSLDGSLTNKSATVHQESTKTFNNSTHTSAGVQIGLEIGGNRSMKYDANMSSNSAMNTYEVSRTRMENIENSFNGIKNKLAVFKSSGSVATSSQNYTKSIQKDSFGVSEARSVILESSGGDNINNNSYFNTSNGSIAGQRQSTDSSDTNQSVMNSSELSNSKIINENVGYGKYSVRDQHVISNNNKGRIILTTSLLNSDSFKGSKISDSVLESNGGIIVSSNDTNTRQTSAGIDFSGSPNKENITTSDKLSKNSLRNLEYHGNGVVGISLKNHANSQIISSTNRQGSIENSMVYDTHNGNLRSSDSDATKGVGGVVVNHNHQYLNTTSQGGNIMNSASSTASGSSEFIKAAKNPINNIPLQYSINTHDGLDTIGYFNINGSQSRNDRHGTSKTNENRAIDNYFDNNGFQKDVNGDFTTAGSGSNARIQTSGKNEYSVNETPKDISSNSNFGNTQSFSRVFGSSKSHEEGVVQNTTETIGFWGNKDAQKSHRDSDKPCGGKIDTGIIKIINEGDRVSQNHNQHFMVGKEQRANNYSQERYESNNEGHGKHLEHSKSRTGQWISSGEITSDFGFKSHSEGSKNVGSHQVFSKTYKTSMGGSEDSKSRGGGSEQHKSQFGGNKSHQTGQAHWSRENEGYLKNSDNTERHKSLSDITETYNGQHRNSEAQGTQSSGNIGNKILNLKFTNDHRGNSNNHERIRDNESHENDWEYFNHRRGVQYSDAIAHNNNVRTHDNSDNHTININNNNLKDNKYVSHKQGILSNFDGYNRNAGTHTVNEAKSSHQGSNERHSSNLDDRSHLSTNAMFGSNLSSSVQVQDKHWRNSSGNRVHFNSSEPLGCQCNRNVIFENLLQYSKRLLNDKVDERQSDNKNHESNSRHLRRSQAVTRNYIGNHDHNVNREAVGDFHIYNNERINYEGNKHGNHNAGTNTHASNEREESQWRSNKAHRIICGDNIHHSNQASVSNAYNNQWNDHDTHHNPLPNGEIYRHHSIGSELSERNSHGKEDRQTLLTNESNRRENYENHQINTNGHKEDISDNGGQEKISTGTIVDGSLSDNIGITKENHHSSGRGYTSHSDGKKDRDSQRDASEDYGRKGGSGENQRSESHEMPLPGSEGRGSHWGSIGYGSHPSSNEDYTRNWDGTESQTRHSGVSELHASHWSGSIGYVKHWDNTGRHESHESGNAAYANQWADNRGHESHSSGIVGYVNHWGVRGRHQK